MALGGLAPVIIFTFLRELNTPSNFIGPVQPLKIPLVPIPIYLDEKLTGMPLDDYNRTISCEMMRDGSSTYERVSGDVVVLKFRAQKSNVVLTAISAMMDKIIKSIEKKNYKITVFYDNIFLIDGGLEQFQTTLVEGTDLREISIQIANRPPAVEVVGAGILKRIGSAFGLN